jgi:hypothetical protein
VKGIAAFVAVLLTGVAVAGYVVTRPQDRDLDAVERAWVREFRDWRDTTERRVGHATIDLAFTSEEANARLLEPLRACFRSLGRLGPPPTLVASAHEAALAACGQAEYAVRVNDRFGFASLATTKSHLDEAGDQLRLAERNLRVQLGEARG